MARRRVTADAETGKETIIPPGSFAGGGDWKAGGGSMVEKGYDKVSGGVTALWLAQAFGMANVEVKKKLATCPVLGRHANGNVYSLAVAAQYLVKPVVDVEQYLRTINVKELPANLQDNFWSAMLRRLKYEEEAGYLWRTEHVMKMIGDMIMSIANDHRTWLDEMEERVEVTQQQRTYLDKRMVALSQRLSDDLAELARTTNSRPVVSEMDLPDPMQGLTVEQHEKIEKEFTPFDDYESLI